MMIRFLLLIRLYRSMNNYQGSCFLRILFYFFAIIHFFFLLLFQQFNYAIQFKFSAISTFQRLRKISIGLPEMKSPVKNTSSPGVYSFVSVDLLVKMISDSVLSSSPLRDVMLHYFVALISHQGRPALSRFSRHQFPLARSVYVCLK